MSDFHDRSCGCGECAGVYGERDAVVAWLRAAVEKQRNESVWERRLGQGDGSLVRLYAGLIARLADAIERGEHVEGRDE